MNTASSKRVRLPRMAKSLVEAIRHFLTPTVLRQAHRHAPKGRKRRWHLLPLVVVLLAMTWCCGDSLAERFEIAKAFCVVCHAKQRRPGKTFAGFQKALRKVPTAALKALSAAVRGRLQAWFANRWAFGEWVPFSVDGSRLQCPLTDELRQRLGRANRQDTAPSVWVTTIVQLRFGLLWAWRLGKGTASERLHLLQMLATLPAKALIVADAGFGGYVVAETVIHAGLHCLIRMCSNVTLRTDGKPGGSCDQAVWYWPQKQFRSGRLPLRMRLLRIRARKGQRRYDVYLLTDVMDKKRLSHEQASQLYRWRWQNEGMFRTYKRTLAKVKLLHRTVRLVHREAEGSLLATQMLLALGAWGVNPRKTQTPQQCSPREVLLIIRMEILSRLGPRQRSRFAARMAKANLGGRLQKSAKHKRRWARRYDHEPPKPPKIRKITEKQKQRLQRVKNKNPGAFS